MKMGSSMFGPPWWLISKQTHLQGRRHRFNCWVGWFPGEGNGLATHSSILAWRMPWTGEHSGLQFLGHKRVRHDLETKQQESNASKLAPWSFWSGSYYLPFPFLWYSHCPHGTSKLLYFTLYLQAVWWKMT